MAENPRRFLAEGGTTKSSSPRLIWLDIKPGRSILKRQ